MSSKPFGLHSVVVARDGTFVAFPVSQTLEFKERIVSGELPGDDGLQATAAHTNGVEWKAKAGGIPLEAFALMTGRQVVEAPAGTRTLASGGIGLRLPYFDIYGQSLGDGEDDVHIHIIDAKIFDSMANKFEVSNFTETEIGGIALDWEQIEHDEAEDLPSS